MPALSPRAWFRRLPNPPLPRRTIRLRLTALYGGLFLGCGAAVLAITYLLVEHAISGSNTYQGSQGAMGELGPGSDQPPERPRLEAGGKALTAAQAKALGDQLRRLAAEQRSHELHQLLIGSGIALAIMAVLAVGLGWLLAGRVLRPLRTITEATRRISEQNLHERLALRGPDDELKTLGDTIDALLARLEDAFDAQRRFVANASHELRTPLTMMRTAIDVATGKPGPARPDVNALAAKIELGLDKADLLVEAFLALAQAQYTADRGEEVAIDEIVAKVIAERRVALSAAGLRLDQDSEHTQARSGELLATHLVGNLLDNAIRHNEPHGWIKITTRLESNSAVLIVENAGRQLDQHDVDQLAQPFRRITPDRTNASGFGLGLSIVAAIVTNCGGTLDLHARPGGGLRVVVTLPRAVEAVPAAALARSRA